LVLVLPAVSILSGGICIKVTCIAVQIERLEAKPEVPEAELAEARTQADAARPLYEQVRCCLLPKTWEGVCNQPWLFKGETKRHDRNSVLILFRLPSGQL
jgi:hypothetical protein